MFQTYTCWRCRNTWEHYQNRSIVPPCPACGSTMDGGRLPTRDEYYRALGVRPQGEPK